MIKNRIDRPVYQNIEIACKVKSDASREKLEELFKHVQKTSPALDIIRNAEPITITIEFADNKKIPVKFDACPQKKTQIR